MSRAQALTWKTHSGLGKKSMGPSAQPPPPLCSPRASRATLVFSSFLAATYRSTQEPSLFKTSHTVDTPNSDSFPSRQLLANHNKKHQRKATNTGTSQSLSSFSHHCDRIPDKCSKRLWVTIEGAPHHVKEGLAAGV